MSSLDFVLGAPNGVPWEGNTEDGPAVARGGVAILLENVDACNVALDAVEDVSGRVRAGIVERGKRTSL